MLGSQKEGAVRFELGSGPLQARRHRRALRRSPRCVHPLTAHKNKSYLFYCNINYYLFMISFATSAQRWRGTKGRSCCSPTPNRSSRRPTSTPPPACSSNPSLYRHRHDPSSTYTLLYSSLARSLAHGLTCARPVGQPKGSRGAFGLDSR